jgi:hypothetical protein
MYDRSVMEVYRAKNGAQAHLLVMALEEAGIKAEIRQKRHGSLPRQERRPGSSPCDGP